MILFSNMNNFILFKLVISKTTRFWLSLLVISAIFWLGGINARAIIGNELLNYDEFSFRTSIPPDEENAIFKMIANTSILIIISYFFVLVSTVCFLISFKGKLKLNTWLLMCSILFFAFIPVEVYTSILDYKFIILFYQNPPNHDGLLKLFGERIGFFRGVPWIALLCYYTIIVVAIFKPLKLTAREFIENKKMKESDSYVYHMHEEDDLNVH